MPFFSPAACLIALPNTIPVSSMLWWQSTSRSPWQSTSRSNSPCLANPSSIWSKKRIPVCSLLFPVPSRHRRAVICVSFVSRLISAVLITVLSPHLSFFHAPGPISKSVLSAPTVDRCCSGAGHSCNTLCGHFLNALMLYHISPSPLSGCHLPFTSCKGRYFLTTVFLYFNRNGAFFQVFSQIRMLFCSFCVD